MKPVPWSTKPSSERDLTGMSIGQPMWVFDSSALIGIKVQVDVADQWDTGSKLLTLVEEGRIVFPKEVRDEVASGRYPDLPGAWAAKAWQVMPCKPRRDSDTMRRVLAVEPNWEMH